MIYVCNASYFTIVVFWLSAVLTASDGWVGGSELAALFLQVKFHRFTTFIILWRNLDKI